jgi:CRISPR-associated protein Cas2
VAKRRAPGVRSRRGGRSLGKRFLVVSYDISQDRRRRKVMKLMKNYGRHVQYSVFECELRPREIAALKRRITPLLEEKDNVRFYYISEDDVSRIECLAGDGIERDPLTYIV